MTTAAQDMSTETTHTPTPYRADGASIKAVSHGKWFVVARADATGYTKAGNENNARRIVACVNACQPFSTDALEKIGSFNDGKPLFPRSEIHELILQRDELAAVLRTIVELDDGDKPDLWHFEAEFNAARAALAKVTT